MWARLAKAMQLTRGERGLAMAYGTVTAVAAGITALIMSSLEGAPHLALNASWGGVVGGLSAGVALFLLRDQMGRAGAVGLLRAVFGCVMVAVLTALIAGTLIAPFFGAVMGPALLLAAFVSEPILAAAWFVTAMGVHFLLLIWTNERSETKNRALSQLSSLSQMNLYGKIYDY